MSSLVHDSGIQAKCLESAWYCHYWQSSLEEPSLNVEIPAGRYQAPRHTTNLALLTYLVEHKCDPCVLKDTWYWLYPSSLLSSTNNTHLHRSNPLSKHTFGTLYETWALQSYVERSWDLPDPLLDQKANTALGERRQSRTDDKYLWYNAIIIEDWH